jgi:hypothetical protein
MPNSPLVEVPYARAKHTTERADGKTQMKSLQVITLKITPGSDGATLQTAYLDAAEV